MNLGRNPAAGVILMLTFTCVAAAQTPLTNWKYQAGQDDPHFADPNFDDSSWRDLRMPAPQHPAEVGFAWYRTRLQSPQPELLIGQFEPAYEVFANGVRIGQFGSKLGSISGQVNPEPQLFKLPASGPLIIAIRAWRAAPWTIYVPSGSNLGILTGSSAALRSRLAEWELERLRHNLPLYLMCCAIAMAALFFIAVPVWRRDAPEYFWCGAWFLDACLVRILQLAPHTFGTLSLIQGICTLWVLAPLFVFTWVRFIEALFRMKTTRSLRICAALAAVIALFGGVVSYWFTVLFMLSLAAIYFAMAAAKADRRPSMLPIHLSVGFYFAVNVLFFSLRALKLNFEFALNGYLIEPRSVALLLFSFSMAVLLNQRSARMLAEQERMKQELAAAAEVQSLLLAASSQQIAGLEIETVYLPASEVGGDFFQILPLSGGATLIAVGDVSGKGLQAAMMVSLVVGCLRREICTSPAAILTNLNHALTRSQSHKGFVTCCCAVIHPDGRIDLANAGHLNPYLDGAEFDLPPGLPLGVHPGETYQQISRNFTPGDRFVFLSDGVVEAANPKGELFGFDRTREITARTAQQIAATARTWGQNDDITVVTVRRTA